MKKDIIFCFILIIIILSGCNNIKEKFFQDNSNNIQTDNQISQRTIGFIGCSNTRQTVYGYRWSDGKEIWKVDMDNIHDYDSGSVFQWAKDAEEGSGFWNVFDQHLRENPKTTKVWIQLCIPGGESKITYEQAFPVIEAVRKRISNVTLYVSPLADYTENVCEITGIEGIERAKTLAQELDSKNEDVFLGPILGPLSLAEITTNDRSRCHPNEEGMLKMGKQLKEFFNQTLEN
ncbi:hypothetical protein J4216_06040 [Candidatus Woesearchaeota archaeon]|nr:hypothetical protein [Candidatus Woesearchaeota archaeon]